MSDLHKLAAQIEALTPQQRLRMAADALDEGRGDIAHMLAEPVVLRLGTVIAIERLDARGQNRRKAGS